MDSCAKLEKDPKDAKTTLDRGLISKVRDIYRDTTSHRTKKVLLVLVGSGLDIQFRNDSFTQITDENSRENLPPLGWILGNQGRTILKRQELPVASKSRNY